MADMVAGAVGFTWVWNPKVGAINSIASLSGLTCTMIVSKPDIDYRAVFVMTVATDGTTASYTTQSQSDFPAPGVYSIEFEVSNGSSIMLPTIPITRMIAPAI